MGRPAEISAQTSMVDSRQAALNQAEWRLDQRAVVSPDAGIVADVLARRGVTLAAGAPVVSLLPTEKDLRVLLHSGALTRAHPRQPEVVFERA
jgi:multidrug resistance efflux pump